MNPPHYLNLKCFTHLLLFWIKPCQQLVGAQYVLALIVAGKCFEWNFWNVYVMFAVLIMETVTMVTANVI